MYLLIVYGNLTLLPCCCWCSSSGTVGSGAVSSWYESPLPRRLGAPHTARRNALATSEHRPHCTPDLATPPPLPAWSSTGVWVTHGLIHPTPSLAPAPSGGLLHQRPCHHRRRSVYLHNARTRQHTITESPTTIIVNITKYHGHYRNFFALLIIFIPRLLAQHPAIYIRY